MIFSVYSKNRKKTNRALVTTTPPQTGLINLMIMNRHEKNSTAFFFSFLRGIPPCVFTFYFESRRRPSGPITRFRDRGVPSHYENKTGSPRSRQRCIYCRVLFRRRKRATFENEVFYPISPPRPPKLRCYFIREVLFYHSNNSESAVRYVLVGFKIKCIKPYDQINKPKSFYPTFSRQIFTESYTFELGFGETL